MLLCCFVASGAPLPLDLNGKPFDPFQKAAKAYVLVFVRTDCPISNRYAPELKRIYTEYAHHEVEFYLVYADQAESADSIRKHLAEFDFGWPALRDSGNVLVKRSHASVTPEAAVFNSAGSLVYHGRIDDLYVALGKSRIAAEKHDLEDAIRATLNGKPVAEPSTTAFGCYLADLE